MHQSLREVGRKPKINRTKLAGEKKRTAGRPIITSQPVRTSKRVIVDPFACAEKTNRLLPRIIFTIRRTGQEEVWAYAQP